MPWHDGELTGEIGASAADCFAELTRYEDLVEWQGALKRCEVVERDERGLGAVVDYEIATPVRTISYRLRHTYDEPRSIKGELIEGDAKGFRGKWSFADLDSGRTQATFQLSIDPGVWIPGKVKKLLHETVMKRTFNDLRRRVEG